MDVRLFTTIAPLSAEAWDALVGDSDPFVEHAFLHTLEESDTVGEETGWQPMHITVWDGERLVGALPLYLKDHSYGEYIFDWAWADASLRLGVPYYPKLVSMVPITPVTGRRFLVHPDADYARVVGYLLDGVLEARQRTESMSVHLLFLNEQEIAAVKDDGRLMPRLSFQFHWHNRDYSDFDDFLAGFRSSMRKQVRRERNEVACSGLKVQVKEGTELCAEDWQALRNFYRDTCARKGSYPYLNDAFFDLAPASLAHRTVIAGAYRDEQLVAASLNFQKGGHLYGRYWGCIEDHPMLHFELCYYQLIERAIAQNLRRFEAGAQGTHKLRRGLEPTATHSAHYIEDPTVHRVIAEFLPREAHAVQQHMEELAPRGPFKR